jgi:hypothetical protein
MRSTSARQKVAGASTSDRTARRRWTRRNVAAVTLLLYASTFMWMTPSFAGTSQPPGGPAWAIANAGALASLALLAVSAWGVFRSSPWWERAASAGGITGLATLVPYGIAASSTGVSGPGLNSAIHFAGSAALLLVVLVPRFECRMQAWLTGGGRPRQP